MSENDIDSYCLMLKLHYAQVAFEWANDLAAGRILQSSSAHTETALRCYCLSDCIQALVIEATLCTQHES